MSTEQAQDADQAAAPLDALLVSAANGSFRRFLPNTSTLRWAAGLARQPQTTAARFAGLGAEIARITAGRSDIAPKPKDRRFGDDAWTQNPLLRRVVQSYLASGQTIDQLLDDVDLEWKDEQRVRFLMENVVHAAAPSNLPLLNPTSAKAAIDTAGLSLVRGAGQLVRDMASAPRIPEMVDGSGYEIGENIAATPGSVVLRTDVLELLEYTPTSKRVSTVPALIVPPTINKYYAIDLAPDRSLVEYLVREGRRVFVISWRNPDARHRDWGFTAYVEAIIEALEAVEDITGTDQTVLGGICSGGILAAMTSAYLAGSGELDRLRALFLLVTVIDTAQAGTVGALTSPAAAEAAKQASQRRGYLDGRALAEVFAWLRPGDLVWNYWVNNYLLGKPPPAFDILYWNSDTTRMTAALHGEFVDLSLDNSLTKPGTLKIKGVPIDLSAVTIDAYVLAGIADHITPWTSCYQTTQLLGGDTRFALSTSGHIAALVNPPGNPKATYRTAADNPAEAETWLATAEVNEGSWWADMSAWLDKRCGPKKAAPKQPGSAAFPPLTDAPGTYVFDK